MEGFYDSDVGFVYLWKGLNCVYIVSLFGRCYEDIFYFICILNFV